MVSERDSRYCRLWKCQVSVGELYRWILAKLSDKDIKRALHKYRDLMPRQSDWNRKLTQATSMPELGFRYLYRCGQIDESNHRTMQKMLKYIDRQDVLPYFDTILYNTNHANCSLEELQKVFLDRVNVFLEHSSVLHEEEVHPEPEYEIIRRQPVEGSRVTRLSLKRKSSAADIPVSVSSVKRGRRSVTSSSSSSKTEQLSDFENPFLRYCGRVRSAIIANSLNGPVVHTMLSASLISTLVSLHTTLSQAFDSSNLSTSMPNVSNSSATGTTVNNLNSSSPNSPLIFHLLAIIPHLIAASRANQLSNPSILSNPAPPQVPGYSSNNNNNNNPVIFGPRLVGVRYRPRVNAERRPPQQVQEHADPVLPPLVDNNLNREPNMQDPAHPLPGIRVPFINPPNLDGDRPNGLLFAPQLNVRLPDNGSPAVVSQQSTNIPVLLKHVVLSAGGIGITTSPHDSLIHYYCNLKLHINIDFGPSTESLRRIQTVRQDTFERQIDFFVQASNMLKARSSSEFVCNLQFTRLNQLEDFWADYQSGALRSYLMLTLKSQPNKCFFGEPPQLVSNQSVSSSSVSEQHNIVDIVEENHSANVVVNASQNLVGNNSNVMANGVGLVNASFIDPPEYSHQNPVHSATSSSLNMAKDEDSLNMLASSIETLHRTFQRMTRRELVTTLSLSSDQLDEFTKFELNLFVSRREYENGRCLLMRNLRAIPSLCQLASVSSLIPSVDSISTRL